MVRDPTCGRSAAFRLSRPAAWSTSSRRPRLSKAYAMVRSPPRCLSCGGVVVARWRPDSYGMRYQTGGEIGPEQHNHRVENGKRQDRPGYCRPSPGWEGGGQRYPSKSGCAQTAAWRYHCCGETSFVTGDEKTLGRGAYGEDYR